MLLKDPVHVTDEGACCEAPAKRCEAPRLLVPAAVLVVASAALVASIRRWLATPRNFLFSLGTPLTVQSACLELHVEEEPVDSFDHAVVVNCCRSDALVIACAELEAAHLSKREADVLVRRLRGLLDAAALASCSPPGSILAPSTARLWLRAHARYSLDERGLPSHIFCCVEVLGEQPKALLQLLLKRPLPVLRARLAIALPEEKTLLSSLIAVLEKQQVYRTLGFLQCEGTARNDTFLMVSWLCKALAGAMARCYDNDFTDALRDLDTKMGGDIPGIVGLWLRTPGLLVRAAKE
jgi:hypothetical protein